MEKIKLKPLARQYKNNGQHAEQVLRYTLTGQIIKADNIPAEKGGDCLDIQIKSARATICKGKDLTAWLAKDGARRYAYVTNDFGTAYIMNKAEWLKFAQTFGTITRDSKKNGEAEKIRLGHETNAMRGYLERG